MMRKKTKSKPIKKSLNKNNPYWFIKSKEHVFEFWDQRDNAQLIRMLSTYFFSTANFLFQIHECHDTVA